MRLAAALLAAAAAAAPAPLRAAGATGTDAEAPPVPAALPRCEVSAELVPPRAYVGQQVHYRLRILRRRDVTNLDWDTPLSFPTFRAEWLPGTGAEAHIDREGETWLVFIERRALFPAHPGHLVVPAAALRCASPDGEEIVAIPPQELDVDPLPLDGRPPGFTGLLGPVGVSARVSAEHVALGESLRVSVLVQGDTNVWNADSPHAALSQLAGVDVFERPDELARDAGRTLGLRRYFSFDLVPRQTGTLALPALHVPYFDPGARRYAESSVQLSPIEVRPAAATPAPREKQAALVRPVTPVSRLPRPHWLAFGAVAAALPAVASFLIARRLRRRTSAADDAAALATLRAAALRGDGDAAAAGAGRLLRAALGVPAALSADELTAQPALAGARRDAAHLLARIERARFAPAAPLPPLDEVEEALRQLRESSRRER